MNSRDAVREIRKFEKFLSFGGFFEEVTRKSVESIVEDCTGCPVFITARAYEYRNFLNYKELMERLSGQISKAKESRWFRRCCNSASISKLSEEGLKFVEWFIENSLNICVDAMRNNKYRSNEGGNDPDEYWNEECFLEDMTWVECLLLSHRYDEEGNVVNTPKAVSELLKMDGCEKYIEEIFSAFDGKKVKYSDEDKKELVRILKDGASVETENPERRFFRQEDTIFDYLSDEELSRLMDFLNG